jgi:hypothetical protein
MKITSLTISNIGAIASEVIPLNKPLLLFYGEIKQGKTTILNCVRWVCGGAYPADIIRAGFAEAFVELTFNDGSLRREFYRNRTGGVSDRPIQFVRAGRPVAGPVAEIKKLLNPFLLNQDYLRNMTETERKKFFSDLFSADTAPLDLEFYQAGNKATILRSKLTGYGNIDLTPVEPADAASLKGTLAKLREDYEISQKDRESSNHQIRESNKLVEWHAKIVRDSVEAIFKLEEQLNAARKAEASAREFLVKNERHDELPRFSPPDTSALEIQIQNAAAQNVLAAQYQKNLARATERARDEQELSNLEARQKAIKQEKISKLAESASGVPGLSFDEDGNFSYQGVSAGMLSTAQLMQLSSAISALYPEGLGVELLDRGESLGKSIFEYIERAKAKDLTVLATIVGEAPAKTVGDVGVFVVEAGKVKPV